MSINMFVLNTAAKRVAQTAMIAAPAVPAVGFFAFAVFNQLFKTFLQREKKGLKLHQHFHIRREI